MLARRHLTCRPSHPRFRRYSRSELGVPRGHENPGVRERLLYPAIVAATVGFVPNHSESDSGRVARLDGVRVRPDVAEEITLIDPVPMESSNWPQTVSVTPQEPTVTARKYPSEPVTPPVCCPQVRF